MAKANVRYIDAAAFELVLLAAGVSIEPQAGFVKVTAPNGHRLYVAKTKRVGRVDLAFKLEGEGFNVLSEGEKFGAIETQLDFTRDPEQIMAAFQHALEHMKALPKPEAKAKVQPGKGAKPPAQGWSTETLKATKAITADTAASQHASLTVRMALSKNARLSAKVAAKLLDLVTPELKAAYLAAFPADASAAPNQLLAADKA